jgi:GntR family transcriptional regulator
MTDRIGLPKSERVALALELEIREGVLGRGNQLQSEGALMKRFSVSRNTVRRGLEILSRQGLITTRTGIGSFVTYDGATIDSTHGWTVALSHGEASVETRLLDVRRGPCARADVHLGVVSDYLSVDRLRYCHKAAQGISLERSRLPWRPDFAPILTDGLTGGSLNATLTALGLFATGGEEVATVLPALPVIDAGIMGRKAGVPMLRLERVTRIADDSVLEYVESILDPDRFGLRIAF